MEINLTQHESFLLNISLGVLNSHRADVFFMYIRKHLPNNFKSYIPTPFHIFSSMIALLSFCVFSLVKSIRVLYSFNFNDKTVSSFCRDSDPDRYYQR